MNVNQDLLRPAEREALKSEIESLRAQLEAAEADRDEQCKLLAAGMERELNFQLRADRAEAERDRAVEDSERLDYIERTFSGMTNRERYLPVQMIWGKGCNGRTLREACDKYMARGKAIASAAGEAGSGPNGGHDGLPEVA